jgi:hypothetical protein
MSSIRRKPIDILPYNLFVSPLSVRIFKIMIVDEKVIATAMYKDSTTLKPRDCPIKYPMI